MIAKVLFFVLLFTGCDLYAQTTPQKNVKTDFSTQISQLGQDELVRHISSAETFQISGDLDNASIENLAIVGIALQRIGNIAIEEGKYQDAVRFLNESNAFGDNAPNRTNLAVAYMRLSQLEEALVEAREAVRLDPESAYARYILGNIYFTKEDYKSALPELEKVLILEPNFDAARALGLTYLYLKQLERAKLLFEEMQVSLGKDNAQLHILFGQAFEQTGYALEAEREFKRAMAIDPKQPRASFYLGYVILQYGGTERLAEAGRAFEQELLLEPNDFYSNFFAGVVASSENDHQKAIRYLHKAVQLNTDSGEAYLFLGQSQLELKMLAEAETSLRRAIELEKTDAQANKQAHRTHFLLGRLLLKLNRQKEAEVELAIAKKFQKDSFDSARDQIKQILGQVIGEAGGPKVDTGVQNSADIISPERASEIIKIKAYLNDVLAQALHNLGVIAVQNNRPAEALEKFAAAFEWKPDFPGLNRNWGIVGFRAGRFEQAITPLSRQLSSSPNDDLIRRMLGASYHFVGDYKQTVETLKPIESQLIADAELAYFYGISLIQLKRNREASAFFDRLAASVRTDPVALNYAAQGFMYLGDYERAVKEFERVGTLAPGEGRASFFRGQSLIRLNRFEEAERAFRDELQHNPLDESSKYHLALTLIERKINTDQAILLLQDAIRLKTDYADAYYQLGKIYIESGETTRAIENLEAAVRSDEKKDYIHYQLSIAYRKALRKEDAERELKIYQKLKSESRAIDQ